MLRLAVPLLFLLSGCSLTAPAQYMVPADAVKVSKTTQPALEARVGIDYRALTDKAVVEKHIRTRYRSGQTTERKAAVFHVAPASRSMLTRTLQQIFTDVEVISGKAKVGQYDVIVLPRMDYIDLDNTGSLWRDAEADVTYELHLYDDRGRRFGRLKFSGDSRTESGTEGDFGPEVRAIVEAMQDTAKTIMAELPKSNLLTIWHRQ